LATAAILGEAHILSVSATSRVNKESTGFLFTVPSYPSPSLLRFPVAFIWNPNWNDWVDLGTMVELMAQRWLLLLG